MSTTDTSLSALLVEDNPNDVRLIRHLIDRADTAMLPDEVDVHVEDSLEAGLDRLETDEFDLLLLDLGLPETSGAETFERVSERSIEVPVIVLTDLKDDRTAVKLLGQGAQDYLNKGSLNEETLTKSIGYALERQEREDELRRTKDQLEVLNRILRHDVRNDVQVMRGWGEHLLDRIDDAHREELELILETSEHIAELTENSRAYMEAVTGEADLDVHPVSLDGVVSDEFTKARSRYPDAEFELADPFPSVAVRANEMLTSVFRNLLNNAVLHNDDAAHVEVAIETDEETARVRVADDGPGVPPDRREDIFGKNEKGLASEGTGIGLYLVYTLVSEFGGDVWIEDNDPRGSVFVVELERVD